MKPRFDVLPWLVLGFLAALLVVGYYVFPAFFRVIHHTDCVASGRTDCG